jgi:hypothetical protein
MKRFFCQFLGIFVCQSYMWLIVCQGYMWLIVSQSYMWLIVCQGYVTHCVSELYVTHSPPLHIKNDFVFLYLSSNLSSIFQIPSPNPAVALRSCSLQQDVYHSFPHSFFILQYVVTMSCVTFFVVLRMVFNIRRFGTLCLFHLHRRVDAKWVI